MPWGWICAQIIRDRRSTKVAKKVVVGWHLTFLRQDQVCFPMHLYEPHNICMKKLLRISDDFSWSHWAKVAQIFSSPEQEVLMVSYCGQSMSVVCHGLCGLRHVVSAIALKALLTTPTPLGQLAQYLVASIRVTYKSKIVKIVPIGNPRWLPWPPSWKSTFCFFSWTERPIDSKLARKHQGETCRSNIAKIMSKSKMATMAAILKICFSLWLLN